MPSRLARLLTPRDRGSETERACCEYLQQQGLKLLESNYRCKRGEIDLVMQHDDTLVFVEVRYRKNNHFGSALESITASKQHKLRLTAEHYLQNKKSGNARFDVVAVSQNSHNKNQRYSFEWIQNAF